MERYASYKDSGIEWIGNYPSSWSLVSLSSLVDQRKNKNSDLSEDNVLSLSYGQIKKRARDNSGLLPESFDTYNIIEDGDIVLRLTDLQNDKVSLRVGRSSERGIITSAYTTLAPRVVSKYLFYMLAAFDYWKGFYGLAGGVRQSLNYDGIKNLRFLLPSQSEQMAIADYLDQKTTEIDSLIEQTERSIELLEEYRKSVISEAVTKGLNSNAPMKDSGIDWIGEIPQAWSTQPLKYITLSIESGRSVDGSNYPANENEYGVLTLSSVYKASFNPLANKAVEDAESISLLRCPVKGESLLISRCNTSEWVGTAAIVEKDIPNLFLPDKIWQLGFSSWTVCRWIWYSLQSNYARHYFAVNSVGASSTMQNISKDDLLALVIPVPPANEQKAILDHLDKEVDAISQSVTARKSLIAKLQEYRKSLISEAVTGKFVVSGVEQQ